MNQEANMEQCKATERTEIKKAYIKMRCDKCDELAYYIPLYSKKICPKCVNIPIIPADVDLDSLKPMDFLSEKTKADIEKGRMPERTRYALRYANPEEYPMRNLPERNEKCVCGSGAKFKKCCLPKIEAQRFTTIDNVLKRREDNEVVVLANTIKMINSIIRAFDSDPSKTMLPVEVVSCKPFKDVAGTLSENNISDGNIVTDKDVKL